MILKSPFPYFGGKRKIAEAVWRRFGTVKNYVEPFFGSGAMLLACPMPDLPTETINDADGLVANFWRALQASPEAVADFSDWPVNENDLHARHSWLVGKKDSLQSKLEGDPEFYDAKVAGWWVWGMACWIGSGFCSGKGPWQVQEIDGVRQLVHVGNQGQGVNRQLVHVGDQGRGVNRQREDSALLDYFNQLSDRLRKVRVCCGDWSRVCGESVTTKHGTTAIFLDPPYADTANRCEELYRVDCLNVAHDVRRWAIENSKNPLLKIALCGYLDEHEMPPDWECLNWSAGEGFGGQSKERTGNGKKECVWFSPNCKKPQSELF
jgi:DNA adenine methylase